MTRLMKEGRWPNRVRRLPSGRIDREVLWLSELPHLNVFPDDPEVCLRTPSTSKTLADDQLINPDFYASLDCRNRIDDARTLKLGDFAIGADSLAVLNYEAGSEPRVMFLRWHGGSGAPISHEWVCSHESFDALWADIVARGEPPRPIWQSDLGAGW